MTRFVKILLFGASGMVGKGVLLECLADDGVSAVTAVGRSACGIEHPKLTEVLREDMHDVGGVALGGWDACFFCLGASAAGMKEADYRRITFDLTLAWARALVAANPAMTFVYVSGAGTDTTKRDNAMWARVKGQTENALLGLAFRQAYMFRPGLIQPQKGVVSKTASYRAFYTLAWPFMPLLKALLPGMVTTTERVGKAMLRVARDGYDKVTLENRDINSLAR
jgi:uncharacterized protein YbjT (DUF2867 family)